MCGIPSVDTFSLSKKTPWSTDKIASEQRDVTRGMKAQNV